MLIQNKNLLLFLFFSFSLLLVSSTVKAQDDSLVTDENYEYTEEEENLIYNDSTSVDSSSQESSSTEVDEYYERKIEVRKVDEKKWESLTKDLNYSEENEIEKPKKNHNQDIPNVNVPILPVFQYLIFGAVIAIIVFILLRLLGVSLFGSNKNLSQADNINIDRLDEDLHESDLDRFLKEALNKREYKLAIRIYYLLILKELSLRNWIEWKKDKTNREYLYEMSNRENYNSFIEVTRIFERTWYGDNEVMESDFHSISPIFKQFVEGIRRTDA